MLEKYQNSVEELITIRDWLRWATSRFNAAHLHFGHGTDNAWDEAVQLVMPTLHLPLDASPQLLDARLTLEERHQLLSVIDRRLRERVPAAYITGRAWFAGLEFVVDERVLVPRSPIAELIAAGFEPWIDNYPHRILDLCTGSGCIGIACAHAFADAEVVVSDIDAGALEVARENVALHQLQDQVTVVQSDLFANLKAQKFHLMVCNPPYVNTEDLASMPREYAAEPAIALGSGSDGLDFCRRLLREARQYLHDDGLLVVELGNSWPQLEMAFPAVAFTWVEFENGGHGVFVLRAAELDEYAGAF